MKLALSKETSSLVMTAVKRTWVKGPRISQARGHDMWPPNRTTEQGKKIGTISSFPSFVKMPVCVYS